MRTSKWYFWKWLRDICSKKMERAYRTSSFFDTQCPKCKRWSHEGNSLSIYEFDADAAFHGYTPAPCLCRCDSCGHEWRATRTMTGFVYVGEKEELPKKEEEPESIML